MPASPLSSLLADTPSVVIDLPRLRRNIERMQQLAHTNNIALWPHVKTHKCSEIAALQIRAGAQGLTVAKPDEAVRFLQAGYGDILVAYPGLSREKVEKVLAAAAPTEARITFTADSPEGVAALAEAAGTAVHALRVMVKVDVGLHRCGVAPDDPALLTVVRAIGDAKGLLFAGLLSHAGQAYGAPNATGVREVAALELGIMRAASDRLERDGLPVPLISVGATPTVLAHAGFIGVGQIRPGNYVFCDLTQVRLGLVELDEVALHVMSTVVSRGRDWAVIDAGSKTLSSDRAPHGGEGMRGYGLALPLDSPSDASQGLAVERLSEEHAVVVDPDRSLRVGDRVRVYPNHACPVMNLADRAIALEGDGSIEVWPITARACVR